MCCHIRPFVSSGKWLQSRLSFKADLLGMKWDWARWESCHQPSSFPLTLSDSVSVSAGFLTASQTIEAILLINIKWWLHIAHTEVQKAHLEGQFNRRLAAGPQPDNAHCPTDPFPICCPCVKRNPTSTTKPKMGPVLVVVPLTLVGNWIVEWDRWLTWLTASSEWSSLSAMVCLALGIRSWGPVTGDYFSGRTEKRKKVRNGLSCLRQASPMTIMWKESCTRISHLQGILMISYLIQSHQAEAWHGTSVIGFYLHTICI